MPDFNSWTTPGATSAAHANTEPPRRPRRGKRAAKVAGLVGIGAIVGIALGSSAAGGTPEPEVRTVTEVKTETEYVDRTPAACIDSIDKGEALVQQVANYLGAEADAWNAASTLNAYTLDAASGIKQDEADKLVVTVEEYLAEAQSCKGANS